MVIEPSRVMRLRSDQKVEIENVRAFRKTAFELRSQISQGSYDDEELRTFWALAERANLILRASNTELAERAGLGDQFFSSVARDRRRPKLTNFLKALTAMIDVADERLFDVDNLRASVSLEAKSDRSVDERIAQDRNELLLLASTLAVLARAEIQRIDEERPNDPVVITMNTKQRELLVIFANGFERIATSLAQLESAQSKQLSLGKASKAVRAVAKEVNSWWKNNAPEAIDWGVRIPTFVAGVAALGWAGANMTIATSAIAAMVGGTKVIDAIRGRRNKPKSK